MRRAYLIEAGDQLGRAQNLKSMRTQGAERVNPKRAVVRASRIFVMSPHLDDAALSLGAMIERAGRLGSEVTVVTVFGGDPASVEPAASWDRACGFATVGEATRARREEDAHACAIMGASPKWLPFSYECSQTARNPDEIWLSVAPELAGADLVLTPGFPLEHPDHAWLTRLVLERLPADVPVALYVEQPYANLKVIGRGYSRRPLLAAFRIVLRTPAGRRSQQPHAHHPFIQTVFPTLTWVAASPDRQARVAKAKAIEAYASQLGKLGGRVVSRIRFYDSCWGGEGVGVRDVASLG